MLAAALRPYGGIVMWRAFVYSAAMEERDRTKQAYLFFKPLDGQLAENVILQVKNGPLDFQVREPVHPLLGGMPATHVGMEVQITQEYTGWSTHLCWLVPQWKETLGFDMHTHGAGSYVKSLLKGSTDSERSLIAGVANVGSDMDWTGHPLAQANWYGFGRLAWNPDATPEQLAYEWVTRTFGHHPAVVSAVTKLLLHSWTTYESYTSPFGLGLMCDAVHYRPDPARRVRYHHATQSGVGYDRTLCTGSQMIAQYAPPVAQMYDNLGTCPKELLLWFHHVPYTYPVASGKTLIQALYDSYWDGVKCVQQMLLTWRGLEGLIDDSLHATVLRRFEEQLMEAKLWRDTCTAYFRDMSGIADTVNRVEVL